MFGIDTSTLLWLTALVLFVCGVAVWWKRRSIVRELRFDSELDDTNTWLATIGKVKGDRPLTPPPSATVPGVVRVAPVARTDETVAFRYPEPAGGDRPRVHRFVPETEAPYQPPREQVYDSVHAMLPETETFAAITAFTEDIVADTQAEIDQMKARTDAFMRQLLGADEYGYMSEYVDRTGGPRAITGGSWTA